MPVIRASEVIIGNNSPKTPKLGHAIPKDRLLDDTELNAVTGGMVKGATEAMTQRAQQNVAEGMVGLGEIIHIAQQ